MVQAEGTMGATVPEKGMALDVASAAREQGSRGQR